jgi:hypothetical protein
MDRWPDPALHLAALPHCWPYSAGTTLGSPAPKRPVLPWRSAAAALILASTPARFTDLRSASMRLIRNSARSTLPRMKDCAAGHPQLAGLHAVQVDDHGKPADDDRKLNEISRYAKKLLVNALMIGKAKVEPEPCTRSASAG